jgi:hypothetical protein
MFQKGHGSCSIGVFICLLLLNLPLASIVHRKQDIVVLYGFCRRAFAENISFKSSGIICWSPLPSSLPGKFSTDKRDSTGFFSTQKACMIGHRSYKATGSLLVVAHR